MPDLDARILHRYFRVLGCAEATAHDLLALLYDHAGEAAPPPGSRRLN